MQNSFLIFYKPSLCKAEYPIYHCESMKISDETKIFENGFFQSPDLSTSHSHILPWAEGGFFIPNGTKLQAAALQEAGIKAMIFCVSRKNGTGLYWLRTFHRLCISANFTHAFSVCQFKKKCNKLWSNMIV